MLYKSLYTAEQWETLKSAIEWVLGAVAGADGKIDQKELDAVKKIHKSASKFDIPFVQELLNSIDPEDFDQITLASDTDIKNGLSCVSTYLKVLDTKEAADFKKFLLFAGVYVGFASGKFFQSKISEEEEEKLELIGRIIHHDYHSFMESGIVDHFMELMN
jgi:hypothetical protein